jgi:hypothetical protein
LTGRRRLRTHAERVAERGHALHVPFLHLQGVAARLLLVGSLAALDETAAE